MFGAVLACVKRAFAVAALMSLHAVRDGAAQSVDGSPGHSSASVHKRRPSAGRRLSDPSEAGDVASVHSLHAATTPSKGVARRDVFSLIDRFWASFVGFSLAL